MVIQPTVNTWVIGYTDDKHDTFVFWSWLTPNVQAEVVTDILQYTDRSTFNTAMNAVAQPSPAVNPFDGLPVPVQPEP